MLGQALQIANTDAHYRFDDDPAVFPSIYDRGVNFSVWQRDIDIEIQEYAESLARYHQNFTILMAGKLQRIRQELQKSLPYYAGKASLVEDLLFVSDMFGELFGLEEIGFRLAVLNTAMCPRFHTDRVPCRLLTTYFGNATQWCTNDNATRDEINRTIVKNMALTAELTLGDVALLKGDAWINNQNNGIAHRSPSASEKSPRLVLTLDFV